jgi:hypothetical protein
MRPRQFLVRFSLLLASVLELGCGPCWRDDDAFLKALDPRLLDQALKDGVVSEEECLNLCGYGSYAASEGHPSEVESCTLTWEGELEDLGTTLGTGGGGDSPSGGGPWGGPLGGMGGQAANLGGMGGDTSSLGGFAGTPTGNAGGGPAAASGGTLAGPEFVVRCDIVGLPAICPE